MIRNKNHGFTLIELLVVVAIIGMLLSVIMISFGNSRAKSRDAKRLSDMNQLRTGLEIYFSTAQGYPDPSLWNSLQGVNGMLTCDGVQAMRIPDLTGTGSTYTYSTDGTSFSACGGSTVWSAYQIMFSTERATDIGPAGTYYMGPKGFLSAPYF